MQQLGKTKMKYIDKGKEIGIGGDNVFTGTQVRRASLLDAESELNELMIHMKVNTSGALGLS